MWGGFLLWVALDLDYVLHSPQGYQNQNPSLTESVNAAGWSGFNSPVTFLDFICSLAFGFVVPKHFVAFLMAFREIVFYIQFFCFQRVV